MATGGADKPTTPSQQPPATSSKVTSKESKEGEQGELVTASGKTKTVVKSKVPPPPPKRDPETQLTSGIMQAQPVASTSSEDASTSTGAVAKSSYPKGGFRRDYSSRHSVGKGPSSSYSRARAESVSGQMLKRQGTIKKTVSIESLAHLGAAYLHDTVSINKAHSQKFELCKEAFFVPRKEMTSALLEHDSCYFNHGDDPHMIQQQSCFNGLLKGISLLFIEPHMFHSLGQVYVDIGDWNSVNNGPLNEVYTALTNAVLAECSIEIKDYPCPITGSLIADTWLFEGFLFSQWATNLTVAQEEIIKDPALLQSLVMKLRMVGWCALKLAYTLLKKYPHIVQPRWHRSISGIILAQSASANTIVECTTSIAQLCKREENVIKAITTSKKAITIKEQALQQKSKLKFKNLFKRKEKEKVASGFSFVKGVSIEAKNTTSIQDVKKGASNIDVENMRALGIKSQTFSVEEVKKLLGLNKLPESEISLDLMDIPIDQLGRGELLGLLQEDVDASVSTMSLRRMVNTKISGTAKLFESASSKLCIYEGLVLGIKLVIPILEQFAIKFRGNQYSELHFARDYASLLQRGGGFLVDSTGRQVKVAGKSIVNRSGPLILVASILQSLAKKGEEEDKIKALDILGQRGEPNTHYLDLPFKDWCSNPEDHERDTRVTELYTEMSGLGMDIATIYMMVKGDYLDSYNAYMESFGVNSLKYKGIPFNEMLCSDGLALDRFNQMSREQTVGLYQFVKEKMLQTHTFLLEIMEKYEILLDNEKNRNDY